MKKRRKTFRLEGWPDTVITHSVNDRMLITFTTNEKFVALHLSPYVAATLAKQLGEYLAGRIRVAEVRLEHTEAAFHAGVKKGKSGE